jgi:hypothetical protein
VGAARPVRVRVPSPPGTESHPGRARSRGGVRVRRYAAYGEAAGIKMETDLDSIFYYILI